MPQGATATAATQAPPASDTLRFATGARSRDTQTFYDEEATLGATSVFLPEAKVPVGDWLEGVWVIVDVTGDNATTPATVALAADAPWSIFGELQFLDAAGNTVQALSGYNWYLQNLLGGFTYQTDPTASTFYEALEVGAGATAGSGRFILRVPVMVIDRELLGAYPNAASNAAVRVKPVINPAASVFTTAPSGDTTVRVRMISTGSVLPASDSPAGRPYAPTPMGAGTFQQWSQLAYDFSTGRRTREHDRKGNVYRELIFVARTDPGGVRSDTVVTNFEFHVDDVPSPPAGPWDYCKHLSWSRQLITAANWPTGVIVVDYCSEWDGKVGGELRDDWVITAPGSKVEIELETSAACTLEVLTNEIVPRGSGVLRV